MLLYVSSSEEGRKEFFGPIMSVLVEARLWPLRWLLLLTLPALVAWQSYQASLPSMLTLTLILISLIRLTYLTTG